MSPCSNYTCLKKYTYINIIQESFVKVDGTLYYFEFFKSPHYFSCVGI